MPLLFAGLCVGLPAKGEPHGALGFIGITQKRYFSYPGKAEPEIRDCVRVVYWGR